MRLWLLRLQVVERIERGVEVASRIDAVLVQLAAAGQQLRLVAEGDRGVAEVA